MSSYYTTAQLEAMRRELLKKELAESIAQLKEQMKVKQANEVQITEGLNIKTSVIIEDKVVERELKEMVITGDMLQADKCQSIEKREALDFSDLLIATRKTATKLELELDSWVKKADERPIVTEKDEKDRTRILAELAKVINASETDIEDKIRAVKMRVTSYLQNAVLMTDAEQERIKSKYYEYCALCEMLEVKPVETLPYRVEKEVERMTSVLEKRRQDEYVMDVIEEIMGELGCHAKDDAVLDHTTGQMYSVDGHPLCDVFVGNDGSGIMFEPVGESKGGSLERQRQIERSANSICSLYATLEERAAEKGVILKRVYADPTHISEMCVQSDISERRARKKQRRTASLKQRIFNSED